MVDSPSGYEAVGPHRLSVCLSDGFEVRFLITSTELAAARSVAYRARRAVALRRLLLSAESCLREPGAGGIGLGHAFRARFRGSMRPAGRLRTLRCAGTSRRRGHRPCAKSIKIPGTARTDTVLSGR